MISAMTTTLMLLLILLPGLAGLAVALGVRTDRPREVPRSHAIDPRFLPPARG